VSQHKEALYFKQCCSLYHGINYCLSEELSSCAFLSFGFLAFFFVIAVLLLHSCGSTIAAEIALSDPMVDENTFLYTHQNSNSRFFPSL
jgi:uncharacterized membrane protein